jgi:hypothetical protein
MRADFYKRTDMELVAMLGEMTDDFIPLSNVSIYPLQGGSALTRSFVCLSHTRIQALFAVGVPMVNAPVPALEVSSASAEGDPAESGEGSLSEA